MMPTPFPMHTRSLPRELLHLAWPSLVAQLAVMGGGVIDTLMAGRISALDLAAVGIGASIYATVFVTVMGVLLALIPVVAHHHGARRFDAIGADVRQSLWLVLVLAFIAVLLLKNPEPFLYFAQPSPALESKVRAYLDGLAWAVPGYLLFRVFYGFTTGIGRPRPVMIFNLAGLALKAPLNWVFMYGHFGLPALGGPGCGWSSAVIAWFLASVAWYWCRREASYAPYGVFSQFEWPRWLALKELLRLGVPSGVSFLVDVSAFTFMALFIARLGPQVSAAHQIAANAAVFLFMVPTAVGSATAVLVGQALGAGNSRRSRDAGLLGLGIAGALGLTLGTAMYFGALPLARVYTPDAAVAFIAAQLLLLVAAYHLADSVQAVMIQVLRAYKRTWGPTMIYAVSLWGVGLCGGYVLGLTDILGPARGAAGFWLAATASLAVASVMTTVYFLTIAKASVKTAVKLNDG
ncbi:MAG: MATE family efflux transporter [Rugosibacter sp.]|nr:MATE family efflux transporter [Rugosibacter sp.]